MPLMNKAKKNTIPVTIITADDFDGWAKSQDQRTQNLAVAQEFTGKAGSLFPIYDDQGKLKEVIAGIDADDKLYQLAHLPAALPANKDGYEINAKMSKADATQAAIGLNLGFYQFNNYKGNDAPELQDIVMPKSADAKEVLAISRGINLIRDLINTPTNDMGPNDLEQAARDLIANFNKASIKVTKGDDLLKENFPMIHAVGRAAEEEPRLIDIQWDNGKKDAPSITIVGKGVCYDTGGLNIKPGGSMALMKKDMGGAAHAIGLAHMIMAMDLPINLRVLLPTVENSISSNAYRPGDVIDSRKGHTVEIDNTDAEGRLILGDALTLACEEKPDLLIDFATLTGAARVALGPEIPAMFANDDDVGQDLTKAGLEIQDPMWQMPLWDNYFSYLESDIADMKNSGGGMAGATTAALFLQKFVDDDTKWVHFDTYGWNPAAKSGRPKGGAAYGAHASYQYIKNKFGK